MKSKILLYAVIIFIGAFTVFTGINAAYAAVGNTFKEMQTKYHMKRIPISKLYVIKPGLMQYNYKNSGIKAYKYTRKNITYEAVFNVNGICWMEFAIAKDSAVVPLSSLIKKSLYGYPILFRTIQYGLGAYEKVQYGRNVGKVIYIMQYIYDNNSILQEAIMPSMSPDGNF